MEKRRAMRITGGYKVTLMSGDASYTGEVDNLSEDGVCVMLSPTMTPLTLKEGEVYSLELHLFSEEILHFRCRMKWARKTSSHGFKYTVGLEIIDPPWDKSSIFI